jgi:hypothetical protein
MDRVKWRWLLPLGHLAVDLILLVALIAYSNRVFRGRTGVPSSSVTTNSVLLLQEGGSIEWDPRTSIPPGPFSLIITGNLPAGIIAGSLRPDAGYIGRRQRWDPVWFLLHEALAFLCWAVIGGWVDAGHSRLRTLMIGFLAVRLLAAVLRAPELGWHVQALFWMVGILWLAGVAVTRLVRECVRAARGAA